MAHLYHANSVITACQFLRQGSLLSRGTIARRGLFQTAQKSDPEDKSYGLWFDVFTDSVDIHDRASRANVYGPVLFVLRLSDLGYTGRIWVTKLNPTKWHGTTHDQRWFSSIEDLENNFVEGRFDQMIVFRHSGGELPIKECISEIILDDPRIHTTKRKIDYFSMAFGALKLAMTEGGIDVPIRKRQCDSDCKCAAQYSPESKVIRLFVPSV